MQTPENPHDNFLEFAWDAAANILYLSGVAFIELVIKPLFTSRGMRVPVIANLVLTTTELVLFFTLLIKLYRKIDGFIREVVLSWTVQTLVERLRGRSNREPTSTDQEILPTQTNIPETTDSTLSNSPAVTKKEGETNDK